MPNVFALSNIYIAYNIECEYNFDYVKDASDAIYNQVCTFTMQTNYLH